MRELRAQAGGDPLRMLYAFDPRRTAILLVAGDKTGDDRWYETHVPVADRLFERHLKTIEKGSVNMAKNACASAQPRFVPGAKHHAGINRARKISAWHLPPIRCSCIRIRKGEDPTAVTPGRVMSDA